MHVLAPQRSFQVESAGHCEAGSKGQPGISALLHPPSSNGGGGPFEDSAEGRDAGTRFRVSEVAWSGTGQNIEAGSQTEGTLGFQYHPTAGDRLHGRALGSIGLENHRRATHVPTSTRRRFTRCGLSLSAPSRDSNQGPVDEFEERAKLREGKPSHATFRQPEPGRSAKSHRGRNRVAKDVPMPALSPQRTLLFAVFIEIFSGCGRLGKSIHRVCAWPVLLWDISFGENYDLTKRANQQLILHWISSGQIRAGHLGTPCNTFSRARDRPGGPPRLRSDSQPLGLADLRTVDQLKVRAGNVLMWFSCRVLHMARRLRLPFTLENPLRSRLWLCPSVRQLMRCPNTWVQDITFCAFGTKWKKPTRFFSVCLDLHFLAPYTCRSSRRGLCQYSGLQHIPLAGVNERGQFLTKIAEPYPWKLTRVLAQAFRNTELAAISMQFQKYL